MIDPAILTAYDQQAAARIERLKAGLQAIADARKSGKITFKQAAELAQNLRKELTCPPSKNPSN